LIRIIYLLVFAVAVAAFSGSFAAGPDDLPFQLSSSLSPPVRRVLESDAAAKRYAIVGQSR
jgi:hypothetical protein